MDLQSTHADFYTALNHTQPTRFSAEPEVIFSCHRQNAQKNQR